MNVEDISDSQWAAVIEGTKSVTFEFLGLQLFITNMRQRLRTKEITLPNAVRDMKNFMIKYRGLPSAQNDLNKIAR